MNTFPWNTFFVLLAAGVFASAAIIPYAMAFNPLAKNKETDPEPQNVKKPSLSTPVLLLIGTVQGGVLIAAASFVGLLAARQVGLSTPVISTLVEGRPADSSWLSGLPEMLVLGLGSAILLLALEWLFFVPRMPRQLAQLDSDTALWKRVLACFYGGISEEILLRLFLMSSLVWLLGLIWKAPGGMPSAGAYWAANILAAQLFGAGHLPATAALVKLTPLVIGRALLLNGIPGVAFGFLYMNYGLEMAMLAHFSLDIVVHLIAPVITRRINRNLAPDASAA